MPKTIKIPRWKRLLERANRAHERGREKDLEVVGFRTISNPRFLDPIEIPVFAREQELRDKAEQARIEEEEIDPKTGKVINRGGGWKFGIPGLKGLFKGDASHRASKRTKKCGKYRCKKTWG